MLHGRLLLLGSSSALSRRGTAGALVGAAPKGDDVAAGCLHLSCGPDAGAHLSAIARFATAGFNRIYVHQVGPDQEGFFRFYERQILPSLPDAPVRRG